MIDLYDTKYSRVFFSPGKKERVVDASVKRRKRMLSAYGHTDVLGSLQRWRHSSMTKTGETDQYPSIAPFLFDFDLPNKSSLDHSTLPGRFDQVVSDAKELRDFLEQECGLEYPQYRVWSSGGYGIHMLIHPGVLGIDRPIHNIMPKMGNFASNLNEAIGLPTVDMTVYGSPSKSGAWVNFVEAGILIIV